MRLSIIIKRLCIIAITGCILSGTQSCTSEAEGYGGFPYAELPEGTPTEYVISRDGTEFSGDILITFHTNRNLNAQSNASWLTATALDSIVQISVSRNESSISRNAEVTVCDMNGRTYETLTFSQRGNYELPWGDIVLRDDMDVDYFISDYPMKELYNNIILGDMSATAISGSSIYNHTAYFNGEYYEFHENNGLTDLSPFQDFQYVAGTIYVMYNSDLTEDQLGFISNLSYSMHLAGNTKIVSLSALEGSSITTLTIKDSPWTDFYSLSGLTNLKTLNISNNQLSDISFLKGLNISELYLGNGSINENNRITDFSPLYGMKNLTSLDLSGLNVPEETLAELKKQLPECDIYTDSWDEMYPDVYINEIVRTRTSILLNAIISFKGISDITTKGFMFGSQPDPETMTEHISSSIDPNTIDVTIGNLEPSTVYYFAPFAGNSHVTTPVSKNYIFYTFTYGPAKFGDSPSVSYTEGEYNASVVFNDTIYVPGADILTYGSVISQDPMSLTTESALGHSEQDMHFSNSYFLQGDTTNTPILPINGQFTGLEKGATYYIRSYAISEYGTSYGKTLKIPLTTDDLNIQL
ncbi:MAG TPA: hypothetical protein IAC04_07925 [Candidatus Coprenecus stercoravium]|uniref:Uncharacterized protein n=1 Tax=Candidatus Coprenecus stercoravium TaxID=2840735 RepID=A0A9D2K9D4_9BACT|nr:hypothetical protein [Candidatus Coprenecus stercoravium]